MLVHLQYSAPHKKGQITVLWIIEIFCILYEPYFELINLIEIKHIQSYRVQTLVLGKYLEKKKNVEQPLTPLPPPPAQKKPCFKQKYNMMFV